MVWGEARQMRFTDRQSSRYESMTPVAGVMLVRGRSLRLRKVGSVNTRVHSPHTSIETRMSIPSSPVTPKRPTSGWMNRK